ncbi:MAG: hypothetical protein ACKO7W_11485 [Elainella sp.]
MRDTVLRLKNPQLAGCLIYSSSIQVSHKLNQKSFSLKPLPRLCYNTISVYLSLIPLGVHALFVLQHNFDAFVCSALRLFCAHAMLSARLLIKKPRHFQPPAFNLVGQLVESSLAG